MPRYKYKTNKGSANYPKPEKWAKQLENHQKKMEANYRGEANDWPTTKAELAHQTAATTAATKKVRAKKKKKKKK